MAFAHLHLHSEYSLLDGACRIKPLVKKIKALGMDACAVTDHGALYGAVDFHLACVEAGIHPVIGSEVYICPDMDDRSALTRDYSHLILLCENNTGYKNLMRLVSEGFTRGFYYKPRIDYRLLEQYHEGLIALTACLSGDLPKLLLEGRQQEARAYVQRMAAIFGPEHFYIELMDHGIREEKIVLPRLAAMAKEMNIPLVATNDCHYLEREDAPAQEVLMCIQTGKTLDDETRLRMETQELYIKDEAQMRALFPGLEDAVERTQEIAKRCNVTFDFETRHLPRYPVEEGDSAEALLRRLCQAGFAQRYQDTDGEAKKRLAYELDVITRMGFTDYFLIVWDFIKYAKDHGIMVGPGRGSGAGSIVAYCLNITLLDPLRYQLLFERFLNPERVSMPDLDIDFCYERRQEVIDYVTRKYGADHVSQIITFGTMAARAVIRDVGRVLGYSYPETDTIAKMVPMELNMTLEKALASNPAFRSAYAEDARVKRLVDMALLLEGMPRHAGTHAAGVLITREAMTEYVPLQTNDEVVTTQYPMGIVDKLNLLKMDFLGLRTLTVIRDTLELMGLRQVQMKPEDIPLDDPQVYGMISQGDTDGVFQLEGSGMRSFLTGMRPENFEDIIAAISLYRPGPMDSIPRYIRGKHDPSSIRYVTPQLAPILDVTYGCIVYQEQVMQIVRDLAGYSMARSDQVRRAMAKKKHDVMTRERQFFVYGSQQEGVPGAVARGVDAKAAEIIFDDMVSFASYAFNKSHAAAYGVLSVQTAWLKYHYPAEFMAAILNSMMDNADRVAFYIHYCRRHDIPLLAPHVNHSQRKFTVDQDGKGTLGIRFGLGAIKSLGEKAAESIVAERVQNGPYQDIFDFCHRANGGQITKRAVESLIVAGCFDGLGGNRAQCRQVYEPVLDADAKARRNNIDGQLSLFGGSQTVCDCPGGVCYPDLPEYPLRTLLAMEKEMTGVYITGHPLDEYTDILDGLPCNTAYLADLLEQPDAGQGEDGRMVAMGGLITSLRAKTTKKGDMMGFAILEDLTGQIECLLFPRVYERVAQEMHTDAAVLLRGKLSIREEEEPKLVVDSAQALADLRVQPRAAPKPAAALPPEDDAALAKNAPVKLYLRLKRSQLPQVEQAARAMPGDVPVFLNLPDEQVTLLAPRGMWCQDARHLEKVLTKLLPSEDIKVVMKK